MAYNTCSFLLVVLFLFPLYHISHGWRSLRSVSRSMVRDALKKPPITDNFDPTLIDHLKTMQEYESNFGSYYPDIIKKSPLILVMPPFFVENTDILQEVNKIAGNNTKAVIRFNKLIQYVSSTAHCILAETPYIDNYCIFLENDVTAEKQMKNFHEWIRKNVEINRFDPMIDAVALRASKPVPNELDPVFRIGSRRPQTHVFISARTYCMKISLQQKDHHRVAQRLPEDEMNELPYVTDSTMGEIVSDDGSITPMPLYVTDDDIYVDELVHNKEKHDSVIL